MLFIVLGGGSIQRECHKYVRANGRLHPGQVFVSSAGRLNCKKVRNVKWNNEKRDSRAFTRFFV